MPRENKALKSARADALLDRLEFLYPLTRKCLLDYTNPFTLLIAVLLSAQTTDSAVNKVTPLLFGRWPDPQALASADIDEVSEVIHSLGFFRAKAKNCVLCAQQLLSDFGGEVPDSMSGLMSLAGVGRKTANIVMNCAFDRAEGIAVDTHVFRITRRLRLSDASDPLRLEQDLLRLIDASRWGMVNHSLVLFGREFCMAQNPRCPECPLADLCPSVAKAGAARPGAKAGAARSGAKARANADGR